MGLFSKKSHSAENDAQIFLKLDYKCQNMTGGRFSVEFLWTLRPVWNECEENRILSLVKDYYSRIKCAFLLGGGGGGRKKVGGTWGK